MFNIKKINFYIITEFIKLFLVIYFSIFFLVFLVDFLEFFYKISKFSIPFFHSFLIILYRIPKILEQFIQFIILISTAVTIKKFSLRSELTIFYSNKISLWGILKIFFFLSFFISIIVIFLLNPINNELTKISKKKELFYTNKESANFVENYNGIWFNQSDLLNNTKLTTKSTKIYLDNFIFKDNIIFIFDEKNNFLERLDIEEMKLNEGFFTAKKIKKFKKNLPMEYIKELNINTNLKYNFIKQKIRNRYENINQMSIFKINNLVKEFKLVGLDTKKFIVKEIIFLITPIIFIIMNMIACLVIKNDNRNGNTLNEIFLVIVIGIIFFILQNIIFELSLAEKINYIIAIPSFLLLSIFICIHKLIKKIELENY